MSRRGLILVILSLLLVQQEAWSQSDTLEIRRLMDRADQFKENNPDSAYIFIQKGLVLANKADDDRFTIDLLMLRGAYQWRKNNNVPAIEDYNQALLLSRRSNRKQGVYRSLVNLGQVYSRLGNYPRAIELFLNGIALGDSIHVSNSLAYNSLAIAYRRNNNFDQAISTLEKSIQLMNLTDRKSFPGLIGGVFVNLGNTYMDKGDLNRAMFYQQKALHIFDSLHQNRGIASSCNNIAEVLFREKKFSESLLWSERSLVLSHNNGLTGNEASALENLGSIASATGNDQKAIAYLNSALQLAQKNQNKTQMIRLYGLMAHSYEEAGRNDLALMYLKKSITARDSVFNQEAEAKIANLRVGFEINKREIDKRFFQQEIEIQILNRNILIGLITALIIILVLLGYYQYVRIKKNKLLVLQMEIIHQTKQQLLQTEVENQKLKQEELQREIEGKSAELTTHALNLIQKNEMLEEIREGLASIDIAMQPEVKKDIHKLVSAINLSHHQDREWLAFKSHFEKIHVGFFEKLQEDFPDLSGNDIKICSLVKLNLGSKETATILGISAESVKTARYRLRKKLKLDPSQNLVSFLSGYK